MKLLFIIFFVTVVTLFFACIEGVVLMNFWNWFAVDPLSLPRLTYWNAVGLTFITSYILQCNNPDTFKTNNDDNIIETFFIGVGYRIVHAVTALLIGYLAHLLI